MSDQHSPVETRGASDGIHVPVSRETWEKCRGRAEAAFRLLATHATAIGFTSTATTTTTTNTTTTTTTTDHSTTTTAGGDGVDRGDVDGVGVDGPSSSSSSSSLSYVEDGEWDYANYADYARQFLAQIPGAEGEGDLEEEGRFRHDFARAVCHYAGT